jgi:hypothetical protein
MANREERLEKLALVLLHQMADAEGRASPEIGEAVIERLKGRALIDAIEGEDGRVELTDEGAARAGECLEMWFGGVAESPSAEELAGEWEASDWEVGGGDLEEITVSSSAFGDMMEGVDGGTPVEAYLDVETGEVETFIDAMDWNFREPRDSDPDHVHEAHDRWTEVFKELGDRYVEVPEIQSDEAWEFMADFADSVADDELRELLEIALNGKGAFRRFKDTVARDPDEQDRWYTYERLREKHYLRDCIAAAGYKLTVEDEE